MHPDSIILILQISFCWSFGWLWSRTRYLIKRGAMGPPFGYEGASALSELIEFWKGDSAISGALPPATEYR
jgi:hypothetical protein